MRIFEHIKATAKALLSNKKILSEEIWTRPRIDYRHPEYEKDVLDIWLCFPKTNTKEKIGTLTSLNFEKESPRIILRISETKTPQWNQTSTIREIENWGKDHA